MSNELKNLTVRYISKCDDVIKSKSEEQAKQLQIQIISAYENLIKNISSNLTYDFPDFNGSGYI